MAGKRIEKSAIVELHRRLVEGCKINPGLTKDEIYGICSDHGFGRTSKITKNIIPYFNSHYKEEFIRNNDHYKFISLNSEIYFSVDNFLEFVRQREDKTKTPEIVGDSIDESHQKPTQTKKQFRFELEKTVYYMDKNKVHVGTIIGIQREPNESKYVVTLMVNSKFSQGTYNTIMRDQDEIFINKNEIEEYIYSEL